MTSRAESALSASRRILTICSGLYLLPFMSCLSFAARLTLYPVHFLGVRSIHRTKSVSHGRQPPLTLENTLNQTAASRWLHALVSPVWRPTHNIQSTSLRPRRH